MSERTEFVMLRVLGPVDVVTAAGAISVGTRHERKILAALAIAANHVVSTDQLALVLWGDRPPASRDNTLQTYVHRLRGVVGPDRIVSTENHSYSLVVRHDELDALVFEQLMERAAEARNDPRGCLALCKSALVLWRGTPFGAFADEDPFRLEAIRLEELRLFVLELRVECELALGRSELVVGALEALVVDYPYRERMWHLWITALSLAGRRVEALRACNQLRDVLSNVGLEPTREILQLEEAILSEDPDLLPHLRFLLSPRRGEHPRPSSVAAADQRLHQSPPKTKD